MLFRSADHAIGNPLSYYNGLSYTFTWKNGRQLSTISGAANLSFEYNEEGIRTSKTANGVEHIYHLNGTQIVAEEWSNKLLIYLYDANGSPIGMQYRTTSYAEGVFDTYWFEKNLQGDIVAVYNDAGTLLVTYTYDAWGYLLSTQYYNSGASTAAQYNPFRYRGYYRDSETGFYYLNSRYYDPNTGRFVNADVYTSTDQGLLGNNMYAYCGNKPTTRLDANGYAWYDVLWDWTNTVVGVLNPISKVTALGSLGVAALQGRWNDIKYDWNNGCLNPFNQSESDANKAKVLSFYKGSTVVRQNLVGTCSMFGTIWAESGVSSETIKHEFGHSVQERFMGSSYIFSVAIPSVSYYCYDSYTEGSTIDYYSTPWERTADWFGGVKRPKGYKHNSLGWAITENILGPGVIPFYFMFGY